MSEIMSQLWVARVKTSMFVFLSSPLHCLFNPTPLNRSLDSRVFHLFSHFPSRRSRSSLANLSAVNNNTQMAQPSNTAGEEISLRAEDGSDFVAYISIPATVDDARNTPTVVLMTDILGCQNEDTRDVANRLASEGFPTSTLATSVCIHIILTGICSALMLLTSFSPPWITLVT